jgi:hypothetical protein
MRYLRLILAVTAGAAAMAGIVVGAATAAKPTITIAWTETHHYDSGLEGHSINDSNVSDACGGTGRIPLSGSWVWHSSIVLEPYDDGGNINYHFVRGRITVTYDLTGLTSGGVTYTGTGKVSTSDLPPGGGFISLTGDDKLKGSDGSVLSVHQLWGAQYGASVFQGYLDAAGMGSWVSDGTCVKAAR